MLTSKPPFQTPAGVPTSPSLSEERTGGGVTLRVVLLCLFLAALFGYIIPIIDVKMVNTYLGAAHLPPGAIAVLLLMLLVVNPLLKLASKRIAFSRNEILTVYITTLFSCLVPGHGAENYFVPNMLAPFYFATPENKWLDFLQLHVKHWMTPALNADGTYNRALTEGWYIGGVAVPWAGWFIPLAAWGMLIFVSYTMLGCLSVILRAQWAEREALSFPLLKLPIELTEDADRTDVYGTFGRFFRNPLVWMGFGIAVFIQGINGLNFYYADVPRFPLELKGTFFSEPPWNQIGTIRLQVWPIVIGITYLLTSEISFSLWFFFWFLKFQLIAAYLFGFIPGTMPNMVGHTMGAKLFDGYQQIGCYLAYVWIVLWTGREHFRHVMLRAVGRAPRTEMEDREPLSYPVAFWGFVLSFLFIVGWSVAAGIRPDIALYMWTAYIVIAIALTRIVVEGGLLFVQQGWVPIGAISQITGAGAGTWLAPSSIVPATFIQSSLMTDLRGFLMPSFIQSFKLAHDRGIRMRPLMALIFAAIAITLVISMYMNTRLGYENGGLTLESWFAQVGSRKPAENARDLMKGVPSANPLNIGWVGVGAMLTIGMMFARSRLVWFPFHPIGFLMCLTYPMNTLWVSIFLGWLAKVLITRFGGSEIYRNTIPAFLGLALGDVSMMLFWLCLDGWQGSLRHQLMPG
jgi:hypothetical protein